jgi:hypothetical protein
VSTIGDLIGNLRADSPWLVFVAAALLAAAGGVARRLMASMQRIGARVGELERSRDSERTRRRQVEAELVSLGVPLSLWPEDPPGLREVASMRRRLAVVDREREDREDRENLEVFPPETTERPYAPPPVPGFTDDERSRLARHRR